MKDKLVFDVAAPDDTDNVGAYLRASNGALIGHAEDSAHVSGDAGIMGLAVRNDAGGSLASADGDYTPLQVDENGSLRVAAMVTINAEKAEDSAHASGDIGSYSLTVREDSLATSTSASGDYQSFKTDALGRLYVTEAAQTAAHNQTAVTDTATDIVGTDLANRKKIKLVNMGSAPCFIGSSNAVTAANGLRLSGGAEREFEVGPGVNLHAICAATGTTTLGYFETA